MSLAQPLPEPFTAEDYFAWELHQSIKHDYYRGEVFAMAGASDHHNIVSGNVCVALRQSLRGTPCSTYMNDMRVALQKGEHYVYPDVFVCSDLRDKGADLAMVDLFVDVSPAVSLVLAA